MGQKLLPRNRSILFVSLVLGYFVKLHQFLQLQEKLQWHKEDRVEVPRRNILPGIMAGNCVLPKLVSPWCAHGEL